MHFINNNNEEKWILCHNGKDIFHIVNLKKHQNLETGQPFIEEFENEEQLNIRVSEMNNIPSPQNEQSITEETIVEQSSSEEQKTQTSSGIFKFLKNTLGI
jgi:hypothetical protein